MHALRSPGWNKAVGVVGLVSFVLLGACSGPAVRKAPVEDRGTSRSQPTAPDAVPAKPLPGAENAGKPGYYTVKPGDTLIRIGLDTGQSWKDIARWNMLDNPNVIEVGQVLRVISPNAVATETGVTTRPVASSTVTPVPVPAPAASAASSPASAASATASTATKPVTPTPVAPAAAAAEDDIAFIWPTSGSLIAGFDEAKNKGLDLGGKTGDAVLAAADGRVVYAGAGLRGYGNLLILKHNNTYLTAYAHNQTLLVKEDQSVRKGQKIAEMGSSDTDRVKLHFEIRRQGKPVDPAKYLPNR
ncbi:peptidoglycan DD-metalloendopeptidase family protein [Rhodoferax sp.]|uniref:peptidoglycan DD-metalloendopeptidase family protein n=1 Tax=Rhodoferax sp. TaxID=50421 RepID=UPI0025FEC64D|nr:peptidoglycan DD-metalloendopeptidase family protein [Rhodoferax sp.]